MTAYRLIKDIGIPRASFYKMIKNESEWKVDCITKIADYFGISLDHLVKGPDEGDLKRDRLHSENNIRIKKLEEENKLLRDRINQISIIIQEIEKNPYKPKT